MFPIFDDLDPEDRTLLELLWSIPGWPADTGKDLDAIGRLRRSFPAVDLHGEAVKMAEWLLAAMEKDPRKRKWNHRQRFVNWIANAARFQKSRRVPKEEDQEKAAAERIAWLREMGLEQ